MFSTRYAYWDILLWAIIVALAAALMLLAMSSPLQGIKGLTAANAAADSATLLKQRASPEIEAWRGAVAAFRERRYNAAAEMLALVDDGGERRAIDAGLRVWTALMAQQQGELETAIAMWNTTVLADDAKSWRYVALVAAHLEQGRLNEAIASLDAAWAIDAANPVVRYYTALVHLEQAAVAREWPDYVEPSIFRLVSHRRPPVAPNTASMYRLAAMHELTYVVQTAAQTPWDTMLVSKEATVEPALRPTVGDLLTAIRAADFEATALSLPTSSRVVLVCLQRIRRCLVFPILARL